MRRRLPPLNALRAFEAAARHNSFAAAAEELNVSHAAISRHVRSLESRLNVTLFKTAKRGVELTAAGAAYLRSVTAAFDAIAEATEELTRANRQTIRLSVHPAFAARWLVQRLDRFRESHPAFDIVLDATSRLADLGRDEADLAIGNGFIDVTTVQQELVARSRLCPVCAPGLVEGRTIPLDPAQLTEFVLLHDEIDAGLWRRWFAAAGVPDADVSRGPRILETGLAIDAAIAGQGVALADEFLVEADLASGRLIRPCEAVLQAADCDYYLRYSAAARGGPAATAFREWLLAESASLRELRRSD